MTRKDCAGCSFDHYNHEDPNGCYNYPQALMADKGNKKLKAGRYAQNRPTSLAMREVEEKPNCYKWIRYLHINPIVEWPGV